MNKTTVIENSKPIEKFLVPVNTFFVSSLFGGPLAAAYLLAKNFKALGHKTAARLSWLLGIVFMVILQIVYFHPFFERMVKFGGRFPINIIIAIIIFFISHKLQGKAIKHGLQNGYAQYPRWKIFIVTIIGIFISVFIYGFVGGITGHFSE